MNSFATPLETHRYQRYSSSAEVTGYLGTLAAAAPSARVKIIGHSAQGRAISALLVATPPTGVPKLRIMIVGSQHGASEAAGCEAILLLARDLLVGPQHALLDELEFVLIPNANPDGRDLDSSTNGNDININRDYVLLTQPESSALDAAVIDFAPDVILDAHESASYKSKTLGRDGYLTDFEAQFDVANTPAIPAITRDYLAGTLLPELLRGVTARGLRAQRYIREITSITQPLTHGGFTIRKFRNKAGIRGPLTVLLETPMEPKAGQYPTYRNIGVRVEKQRLCMAVFLDTVRARAAAIIDVRERANREPMPATLPLNASYVPNPDNPTAMMPLRRRASGASIEVEFQDHRAMTIHDPIELPRRYFITQHCALFAALLARHRIGFDTLARAERRCVRSRVFASASSPGETWEGDVALRPGDLSVSLAQAGRIISLLLDPRSESSVFRYSPLGRLIDSEAPLFIYSAWD